MRAARILCSLLVLATLACTSTEDRIAQHRTAAYEYFDAEEWSEAKIEFLNLLQLAPDDAEAHYKMAETLWNLQEYGEALWQYNETARLAPENAEWRLKAAQVEFSARRYDSAGEHVNAVLERDPENIDALLLRGALKSVQGDLEALMADVDAALKLDPKHKSALALKAQTLSRQGDSAGAEDYMRQLLEVDPSMGNHLSLARYLNLLGRNDEALAEMNAAIAAAEDQEQRTQARFYLSNFYLNERDTDSAEKTLLEAREEDPTNPKILQTLATFYYAKGEKDKAEKMLEENVAQQPDDVDPLLTLAEYHRRLGDTELALATIERALKLDPNSESARLRRAELMVVPTEDGATADVPDEAWAIVREILAANPKSVQGLFNQGKFHLLEGHYEEAATSLRRVIDEQPTANAHVLLGSAYMALGQDDLARTEYQQALQLDAQNYAARAQIATLYLRTNENELAVREARTGLARRPNDLQLRLALAEALTRLNRHHEARDALKGIEVSQLTRDDLKLRVAHHHRRARDGAAAIEILELMLTEDPNNIDVMRESVAVYISDRQPEKALEKLNDWIINQPENADLYDLRGRVRLSMLSDRRPETIEAVEDDLKTALAKGGDSLAPLISLGELYRATDRIDEAIATYERARNAYPEDANVPLQLAVLHEGKGNIVKAKEYYEIVLTLDQSQPEAKNNLAWLLANADEPDEKDLDRALRLAQDAKEALPGNPSVTDTLGWIMYKKGIPSAAISLFREAIEGYPEAHPLRGTVRFHLAKSYERNGETGRAITELKRALDEVSAFNERKDAEALLKKLEQG